jgi:hypothetical protein
MDEISLINFSAADAKLCFDDMLEAALGGPVSITLDDRLAVYVIAKGAFDRMAERVQELDDQVRLLKAQAEANRHAGFASVAVVDALMFRLKNDIAG